MKQELLFAVALLAAGCLLCFSQLSGPAKSTSKIPSSLEQTTASNQSVANGMHERVETGQRFDAGNNGQPGTNRNLKVAVQASYQETAELDQEQTHQTLPTGTRSSLTPELFVHQESSPEAISFLAEISKQVSNSQPIGSSIELTGNLFGQVVSASGDYYQLGQGSHKSRIELVFGQQENSPSVIQLCDGRFVYKYQSFGDQKSLEFVDLLRVREMSGELGRGITPTGWVASGGIASLFQHLASAFNFGNIESGEESSVTLRGSWDHDALRQIAGVPNDFPPNDFLNDSDDSADRRAILWRQIPAQLPHAVELVFRQDKDLNYFPKRIRFLTFERSDNGIELKPMVVLEFSAPRQLPSYSSRYFVVDSTDLDSVDLTEQYVARIKEFGHSEQTAESKETIDR